MVDLDQVNSFQYKGALIEARYPDTFKLPDSKFKILERLSGTFPEYNIEKPEILLLRDSQKNTACQIGLNRLVYEYNTGSFKDFQKIGTNVIKTATEILKISKFSRLGVRMKWGKLVTQKEEAIRYLSECFLSTGAKKMGVLKGPLNNIRIELSSSVGTTKFNLFIRGETEQIIEASLSGQTSNKVEHYLIVDCDVYWDVNSARVDKVKDHISEARRFAINNVLSSFETGSNSDEC